MRPSTIKLFAGLTSGVVGVAFAATWMAGEPDVKSEEAEKALAPWHAEATEEKAEDPGSDGCVIAEGERLAFDLQVEDLATIDLSGSATGAPTDQVELSSRTKAKAELRALASSDGGTLFLGRLREVEAANLEEAEELSHPFMLRISTRCDIEAYAHHVDTPLPYARVQQALLHELQWKWPVDGAERFEGSNSIGRFDAVVARRDGANKTVIEREISSYEPWERGARAVSSVEESALTVEAAGGGWFETLRSTERLRGSAARYERSVLARRIDASKGALSGTPSEESAYVWTDLLPLRIEAPTRRQATPMQRREREIARTQTFEQAVDGYVERVRDESVGIQETWPGLRAYLEVRPEQTARLVEKLRADELPEEATMGVYMALGNADTPEARSALTSIMEDDDAPIFERSRAMLSMIDRADVGPGLANQLSGWATRIASGKDRSERVLARQSMLALGAMAGRRPDDEQVREIAVARIEELLGQLSHPLHLRPVYGAIANVGDPALLSLVADLPSHPDAERREYGAIVLRRMPAAASGDFAARWLAKETSPLVKRELYMTIELQGHDAQEVATDEVLRLAVRDLKAKPSPMTRKALYRLLGRALRLGVSLGDADTLGIEDAMLAMIPYEIEEKSGLYSLIAEYVDPEKQAEARASVGPAADARPASPGSPTTPTTPTTPGSSPAVEYQ